jgi:hypothetical protein
MTPQDKPTLLYSTTEDIQKLKKSNDIVRDILDKIPSQSSAAKASSDEAEAMASAMASF